MAAFSYFYTAIGNYLSHLLRHLSLNDQGCVAKQISAIYLQHVLDLPAPPSPRRLNLVLPEWVFKITPMWNATNVTRPAQRRPTPTESSLWVSQSPFSDTPIEAEVAIYQSVLSASAAAAVPAPKPTVTYPRIVTIHPVNWKLTWRPQPRYPIDQSVRRLE